MERNRGILLHAYGGVEGSHGIADGLRVGGEDEGLKEAARLDVARDNLPRLFLGHSGWAPGQLEGELQRGGWLLRRSHPSWVLGNHDPEELWMDLVQAGNPVPDPSEN